MHSGKGTPGEAKSGVVWRWLLASLLLLAGAAALFLEPAVAGAIRRGALPKSWLFTPLFIFGLFLTVYAVDRIGLVRRHRYPAGRALFQISFGVIFALLLLPSTVRDFRQETVNGIERQLSHREAEVRQLAAEVLSLRGYNKVSAQFLADRLHDPDPKVRDIAVRTLRVWSGQTAALPEQLHSWAKSLDSAQTSSIARPGP